MAGRGRAGTVVVASPAAVVTRAPRPRRAAEVFAGRPASTSSTSCAPYPRRWT
ncbi:hypothetical protein V2I01_37075 [Micromonospora sp. BRA006-A]|nr:hypothetical protein [Micromonospora sp. BRA006-A]